MRRSNFEDQPTDYAAVGATQALDLMQYPPKGYRPFEDQIRLGSGDERFEAASTAVLSWEVQRRAGIAVDEIERGSGDHYVGVRFSEDGTPIARGSSSEERFTADGTPFATSGTSARLDGRVGGFSVRGRVRVVYIVEEPRRVGFALGTVGARGTSGEESFVVEHRDDDGVWFVVRSFERPTSLLLRLLPFLVTRRRRALTTQYLRTLSPAWGSEA